MEKNNGFETYGVKNFYIDDIAELNKINVEYCFPGSTVFIINLQQVYMLNETKEYWINMDDKSKISISL